jgi:hypothetical protein
MDRKLAEEGLPATIAVWPEFACRTEEERAE